MSDEEVLEVPAVKLALGSEDIWVVCTMCRPDEDPSVPREGRIELGRILLLAYEASIDVREQFEKLCKEAAVSLWRKMLRDKGINPSEYDVIVKEVEG